MRILLSKSHDPFFHLAVEETLLRLQDPTYPTWFFYRNRPSVIMGRFQNPWAEVDHQWMQENHLVLARRMSGGGTVYHDLGNVNFAHLTSLSGHSRDNALKVIQQQLTPFGVKVQINARHDLVVLQNEKSFKVSGSAYKQTRDRVLHHGTLLIDANLDFLERSLSSPFKLSESKAVASVRSKVMNLSELNPRLTPQTWMQSWESQGTVEWIDETTPWVQLSQREHYGSGQWRWNETPLFALELERGAVRLRFSARKGLLESLSINDKDLSASFGGRPLSLVTIKAALIMMGLPFHLSHWQSVFPHIAD